MLFGKDNDKEIELKKIEEIDKEFEVEERLAKHYEALRTVIYMVSSAMENRSRVDRIKEKLGSKATKPEEVLAECEKAEKAIDSCINEIIRCGTLYADIDWNAAFENRMKIQHVSCDRNRYRNERMVDNIIMMMIKKRYPF